MDININLFIKYKEENCVQPLSKTKGKQIMGFNIYNVDINTDVEVEKKTIFLSDASKYVAGMFFLTDKKYYPGRAKIEKILSIVQLIAYKYDFEFFPEKVKIKECGVGITEVANTISVSELYDGIIFFDDDESENYINDAFLSEDNLPIIYKVKEICSLSKYSKFLLEKTFRKFAAFDSMTIGKMFDVFKNDVSDDSGIYIDRYRFFNFIHSNNTNIENNTIYKFIKEM